MTKRLRRVGCPQISFSLEHLEDRCVPAVFSLAGAFPDTFEHTVTDQGITLTLSNPFGPGGFGPGFTFDPKGLELGVNNDPGDYFELTTFDFSFDQAVQIERLHVTYGEGKQEDYLVDFQAVVMNPDGSFDQVVVVDNIDFSTDGSFSEFATEHHFVFQTPLQLQANQKLIFVANENVNYYDVDEPTNFYLTEIVATPPSRNALVVNTLVDEQDGSITDGDISLRDAIDFLADGGTITFDVAGTINYNHALGGLKINKSLTIDGNNKITIDGQNFRFGDGISTADHGSTIQLIGLDFANLVSIRGGALKVASSDTVYIQESSLRENQASDRGGAIDNMGTLWISQSQLYENTSEDAGGAIYNSGYLCVVDSTIRDNTATIDSTSSFPLGGGGISSFFGNVVLQGSTLSGNFAERTNDKASGGGVSMYQGSLEISNSTFSKNRADYGGAISTMTTNWTITNSTVTQNSATTQGAGIYRGTPFNTKAEINNSIVAGNTHAGSVSANDLYAVATGFSGSNNIFTGNGLHGEVVLQDFSNSKGYWDIGKVIDIVLRDNGGPTKTHAVVEGSPAIDGGLNSKAIDAAMTALSTDQRGVKRLLGTHVDIGAFESGVQLISDVGTTTFLPFEVAINARVESADDFILTNATVGQFSDFDGEKTTFLVIPTKAGKVEIKAKVGGSTLSTTFKVDLFEALQQDLVTYHQKTFTVETGNVELTPDDIVVTGGKVVGLTFVPKSESYEITISPTQAGKVTVQIPKLSDETYDFTFAPLHHGNDNADVIENLYQTLFQRSASQQEIAYWESFLNSNAGNRFDLLAKFIDSSEYQSQFSSNTELLKSVYQHLFNRGASDEEIQHWKDALDDGHALSDLVLQMLNSDESYQRIIHEVYHHHFARSAHGDDLALAHWLESFRAKKLEFMAEFLSYVSNSEEALSS